VFSDKRRTYGFVSARSHAANGGFDRREDRIAPLIAKLKDEGASQPNFNRNVMAKYDVMA
jgi:hypothetical protein